MDGVFSCAIVVHLPRGGSLDERNNTREESTEGGVVESGCLFIERVVGRSPGDLELDESWWAGSIKKR